MPSSSTSMCRDADRDAVLAAVEFLLYFVFDSGHSDVCIPRICFLRRLAPCYLCERSYAPERARSVCTEANMKQTPQIRLVFTLTKRDGTDLAGRDARGAAFRPRCHARRRPGKGRCSTAVRRFVSRMSKCCPALQFSRGKAPRLTPTHGTHTGARNCRKWTAGPWMSRCSSLRRCCAGKRRKSATYVRNTIYMLI